MDKYIGFGHDLDDLIYGETPVRPSERWETEATR